MGVDAEIEVAEDEEGHVAVPVGVEPVQGVLQGPPPVLAVWRRTLSAERMRSHVLSLSEVSQVPAGRCRLVQNVPGGWKRDPGGSQTFWYHPAGICDNFRRDFIVTLGNIFSNPYDASHHPTFKGLSVSVIQLVRISRSDGPTA